MAANEFRAVTKLAPSKVDAELRQFEGWATKPLLDRTDEIVDTKGVRFHNPTVLLLHHDHRLPVGEVSFLPKPDGIWFKARLPRIEEAGELRDRVEGAWGAVKARLLTSVSIGFRALEIDRRPDGVLVYTKSELYELSLVTVPALPAAQIDPATIKSLGTERPALPAWAKKFVDETLAQMDQKFLDMPATRKFVMQTALDSRLYMEHHTSKTLSAIEARLKALEQRA